MRERIFSIVEKAETGDHISRVYDLFITATAMVSIIPLTIKGTNPLLDQIDLITVYILFLDYILRWMTHDYACGKHSPWAFVRYPITPFALLDLFSILPSLGLLGESFKILRMLRIAKILHYSQSFVHVSNVFRKERKTLSAVLVIALAYIFVSALAMFSYEPDTFGSFFDALYWATTALTTVGYGDIFPKTNVGQLISMISSLFGIAVIALPAGVVTAGFLEEINRKQNSPQMQAQKEQQADGVEEASADE